MTRVVVVLEPGDDGSRRLHEPGELRLRETPFYSQSMHLAGDGGARAGPFEFGQAPWPAFEVAAVEVIEGSC